MKCINNCTMALEACCDILAFAVLFMHISSSLKWTLLKYHLYVTNTSMYHYQNNLYSSITIVFLQWRIFFKNWLISVRICSMHCVHLSQGNDIMYLNTFSSLPSLFHPPLFITWSLSLLQEIDLPFSYSFSVSPKYFLFLPQ